jgi:hypothetical protein
VMSGAPLSFEGASRHPRMTDRVRNSPSIEK